MSVATFDARLGHAIQRPAAGSIIARSAGSRRSSSARTVWKLTITSAVPPARRLIPTSVGQLAQRVALEPVRRAEQRHAVAGLDAELARQRRAAVSGGAARWHGHKATPGAGVPPDAPVECSYMGQPGADVLGPIEALDLRPVFQPIVELRDGAVVGYEALMRSGPSTARCTRPGTARGGAARGQHAGARPRRARCRAAGRRPGRARRAVLALSQRGSRHARTAAPPSDRRHASRCSSRSPSRR